MLKVLPEMVCSIEFLGLIALAEFMLVGQMCHSHLPVWWFVCELFTTISTNVSEWDGVRRGIRCIRIIGVGRYRSRGVKDGLYLICDRGTGPGVAAEV